MLSAKHSDMHDADRRYSRTWFSTFLDTIEPAQTAREVGFLERQLPRHQYPRVLDLCCGPGRHSIPLSTAGYDVTGIDFDASAIEHARAAGSAATFIHDDVRNIANLAGEWDAALIMWASFGYFTAAGNTVLLESIHDRLRPAGRFILDIYNRDFFLTRQGRRSGERGGVDFTESKHVDGERLHVQLDYKGMEVRDVFSWQIFDARSIAGLLATTGYRVIAMCTGFDEARPVTPDDGRMQVVAEKISGRADSSSESA